MRFLVVALLALFACRSEPTKPAQPKPHTAELKPGAHAQPPSPPDPWAVAPPATDGPPDLGERNRLANEACPIVKGPFFFRIEKGGKVSHILGTRHIGVSLTKFPKPVHDAIAAAKLAVFEVAP